MSLTIISVDTGNKNIKTPNTKGTEKVRSTWVGLAFLAQKR